MKTATIIALLAVSCHAADATSTASPVSKVIELLSDMTSKIIKEGEDAQKTYSETAEWCEERSKNLGFQIKTSKSEVAALKATIEEESAAAASLTTKIEELAAGISADESDLDAATKIRNKEASDFAATDKELAEVIDSLQRAISIIEREAQKGGASMLQSQGAGNVVQALQALVEASAIDSADAHRLTALVQSQSKNDDEDGSFGAPAAAVYDSHSGGIVETLEGLLEKAEAQLDAARKEEQSAGHNFAMLKQSLEDEIKFAQKDMTKAKKGTAKSAEKKSTAEGDLEVTTKDLQGDATSLSDLHQTCMTKAQDFEAETKSRGEELKALGVAKQAIEENTGGADKQSYGLNQMSLVQLSSGIKSSNFEAIHFVRDLARKENSPALAQLASRMASAMQLGSGSNDPFGKVKGLLADMVEKLESEAQSDSSHKAYCDKEMSESNEKKDDKTAEVSKLSTAIDQMTSKSQQLKEEVAALQNALSELAASTAEMDKLRKEEKAAYVKNKAEMSQGLEGVKIALKVLREYYGKEDKAHDAAEGAGANVIGLLEVVESDFSKGLAEMTATEESSQSTYDAETKENEVERTTKQQDVKYKTKEAAGLDKSTAEASSDRSGVQTELDAVNEYLGTLKKECVAQAETYSERKARFTAEITGLKEALTILEGEAVLLQRGTRHSLRGVRPHAAA